MSFIKRNFDNPEERLYRAVYPNFFKKEDGSLSSAAFKDRNGLSVQRGDNDTTDYMVDFMLTKQKFQGGIVSVSVQNCYDVLALPLHKPSNRSEKHSEIHRNETEPALTSGQAKKLARLAIIDQDA